jgi:hypothetical protein
VAWVTAVAELGAEVIGTVENELPVVRHDEEGDASPVV